jgi:hypothetical protein
LRVEGVFATSVTVLAVGRSVGVVTGAEAAGRTGSVLTTLTAGLNERFASMAASPVAARDSRQMKMLFTFPILIFSGGLLSFS